MKMSLGSLEGSTLFLLAASEPSGLQDKIQASESLQELGLAAGGSSSLSQRYPGPPRSGSPSI